jgi:hypothetical protein
VKENEREATTAVYYHEAIKVNVVVSHRGTDINNNNNTNNESNDDDDDEQKDLTGSRAAFASDILGSIFSAIHSRTITIGL